VICVANTLRVLVRTFVLSPRIHVVRQLFDGREVLGEEACAVGRLDRCWLLEREDMPDDGVGQLRGLGAFARRGGTVVVQYQQRPDRPNVLPFAASNTAPTPERVTDENAAVTILAPSHKVLSWPNRISKADFAGWVQERGLYMPHTIDSHWKALLEMHDAGDPPNYGGLLVAPLGQGQFVYTTLSFFRQLPAGNPGAARLLVNLLSAGLRAPIVP